ncbi:mitochondrial import inner membrane translocase subunit Tim9-like isoform X2 [Tupaia chinensis]|uniref:mitochondrial import inner membrane translocase subunit Tim9-like isoform X2 n=1 Tax=Tupaia chinensis TaxID=246437 RepID=UPI000703DD5D|nr:mitochondrial import inner membrane translocase subunit Tim9-like isoform X2 [Tupaia chinensis]
MAAQIPESDQIKPFREYLRTFNKLTETCFLDCVKDFTTKEVKPEEQNEALATKAGLLGQPR